MTTILITGDPHLKIASQQLAATYIDWFQQVVEETKPDLAVNLGDSFHTHNLIRSEIMAMFTNHVQWMNRHVDYYILVGNHDMAHHKAPHIHALLPFVDMGRARIIDRPLLSDTVAFLPYVDDVVAFQETLNKYKACSTIFCHEVFKNANYGFVTTKEGAEIPLDYEGQIVSGHIHKGQDLGCVWYPGTPFAQETADHNEVKGIYLYETTTRVRTFIKSPLPQWATSKATPANFAEVIASMDRNNKNHLILEGPGPEVVAAVDSKVFNDLKKEYHFSVKRQSTSSDKVTKSLRKVNSVEDAVVEYVDRIYDGSVDRAKLKAKCLEALK